MLKTIKARVTDLFVMLLLMSGAFMGGYEADAKEPQTKVAVANPIPVVGETADHKYKTYKLEGELDDLRWFVNGKVYNSDDLVKRLPYIAIEDMPLYDCGFICRDPVSKNVVGINPKVRWLYEEKKATK